MGWPISWQTKLVISTILVMGARPMLNNLFFSHDGDAPTVSPVKVIAEYLGHASAFLTSTGMSRSRLSALNLSTPGQLIFRFLAAFISRATPIWDAASARFGVNPISILLSVWISKNSEAGVPLGVFVFNTMIPA